MTFQPELGINRKEMLITTAHNLLLAGLVPNDNMDSLLRTLSNYSDQELTVKLIESHRQREAWYTNINN